MAIDKNLFDEKFEKMIRGKYSNISRWSWPTVAAYILDPTVNQEKKILECIYRNYPPGKHKTQIRNRITSCNDNYFWGAWAELRIYDWLSYKGFKLTPECVLGEGRPDYLVQYPAGKRFKELIMEITTISAESRTSKAANKRIKQMLANLDEIAKEASYLCWVHIPSYYLTCRLQKNYKQLKADFEHQLENIPKSNAKEFTCQTADIKIRIKILRNLDNRKGYIGGYTVGFVREEEENFKKRIYDRILEKIGKYAEELEKVMRPFVVTIFIKGPFFLGSFEETVSEIINLSNGAQIFSLKSLKKLSAILLYETFAFTENNGTITINYVDWLYINPNAEYPVDPAFECLLNV